MPEDVGPEDVEPEEPEDVAVLLFGGASLPRPLQGVPIADTEDIAGAARDYRRLIVVGSDADLAAVLTALLRAETLDVEIGFVSAHRSAATRAYRLASGRRGAKRALWGIAQRVPLIRDDTGHAIAGAAMWRGADGLLHGEAVVDDTHAVRRRRGLGPGRTDGHRARRSGRGGVGAGLHRALGDRQGRAAGHHRRRGQP